MFSELISPADTPATSGDALARFMQLLRTALASAGLQRLVLSKPTSAAKQAHPGLERVTVRSIEWRGAPALSLLWRYSTRDETKNHELAAGLAQLQALLGEHFGHAHLHTATHEVQLRFSRKGKPALHVAPRAQGQTEAMPPSEPAAHDRTKPRPLDMQLPFWQDLGLTHEQRGQVQLVPAMARKWRQINKFIELFDAAMRDADLSAPVRLADFGCGKGYLTVAMHARLAAQGLQPQVEGVELRAELVQLCNALAQRHGLAGLRFAEGDVREREAQPLDVMVALHACDIATDYAMHYGLRCGARIIMCAPCCHKQIRPQLRAPAALRPLLQHGVHLGQEAEMVTDALRALLLELMGYATQVIEFIALEHTSKNKMVLAVRRKQPLSQARRAELLAQLQDIKAFYGLREQALETLLRADGLLNPT
ncbi:class I SAM-dependent methyltransferase [Roseateles sp. BYS180W]|uniref:Class I SAM-dependent methyltransferase n=1 Tax=Roseateles rivi TaxID=3299028 RepID=A0ABW7FSH2_9BURK